VAVIRLLVIALLSLPSLSSQASHHNVVSAGAPAHNTPIDEKGFEPEGVLRVFVKVNKFNHLVEIRVRKESERLYKSLRLGSYYRLFKSPSLGLKVGAFYMTQAGVWHDEDWIEKTSGVWIWEDTDSRWEHLIMLDVTPRVLILKPLVGELKIRYLHNFHESHDTLKVRPGLSYTFFVADEPFITAFVQYEIYIPINYNKPWGIYETWLYLGALYHISPMFQVGVHGALRKTTWIENETFKEEAEKTYEATDKGTVLGLDFFIRF